MSKLVVGAVALLHIVFLIVGLASAPAVARVDCPRDTPHVGKRSCPAGFTCYQAGVRWRCRPEAPPAASAAAPPVSPRRIRLPTDDFQRLGLLCTDYDKCQHVPACHFGGDGGRTWRFTEKFVASQKKRGFSWVALCLAQNNAMADAELLIEELFWPRSWTQLEGDALKQRIISEIRRRTPSYEAYYLDGKEYRASEVAAMQRYKAALMRLSLDKLMDHFVLVVEIRNPEVALLVARPNVCHRRAIPLLDCPAEGPGAHTYGGLTVNQILHVLLGALAAERYGCKFDYSGTARSARVTCASPPPPYWPTMSKEPYSIGRALAYTTAIAHNDLAECDRVENGYCRFEQKFLASLGIDRRTWRKRYGLPRVQVFVDPTHPKGFVYALNPDDGAAGPGFSATALASTLDDSRRTEVRLADIIKDLDKK